MNQIERIRNRLDREGGIERELKALYRTAQVQGEDGEDMSWFSAMTIDADMRILLAEISRLQTIEAAARAVCEKATQPRNALTEMVVYRHDLQALADLLGVALNEAEWPDEGEGGGDA